MANTWNKLKKSVSLRLSSSHSSMSANSPGTFDLSSDVSQIDFQTSRPTTSSSSILRLSRSISSFTRSSKAQKTCAICLGNMKAGQGQAIFTAECSHAFHFICIASSVKHGNQLCPICRSKWKEIPYQAPITILNNNPSQLNEVIGRAPFNTPLAESQRHHLPEPQHFSDDEPLLTSTTTLDTNSQVMTIKALSEFPAVAATDNAPAFSILVGVRAPPLDTHHHRNRAPIDLITVLDVSGSMAGTKISLLKRAVRFVIRNLDPADRLAVVAFSSTARRIFPLRRMSETGRNDAILAINALTSNGGTNIVEGLKKGVRILEERSERNPVASIILLSDGKDTHNTDNYNIRRNPTQNQATSNYLNHLPPSICTSNSLLGPIPVHTFGFGSDHDATAMHAISDVSGGTFSSIQTADIIQDAFARCIGGLLSVVSQQLRLTMNSLSPGVIIGSMPTGKYSSEISNQGKHGVIDVGDLYADEEKDFLVNVSVPVFLSKEENGETDPVMPLLSVDCSYKDPLSQEMVMVESKAVTVRRPEVVSSGDSTVCLEVDRQRNRLWVAEGIAEAQGMAEKGNLEGAKSVLTERRLALLGSASAQAGDGLCNWLEAELKEIRESMASQELYQETGRAYVLSGLSSHAWQRATTRGISTTTTTQTSRGEGGNLNTSGGMGYETPSMARMVTRSQTFSCPVVVGDPGKGGSRRLNKSYSLVGRNS